MKLLNLLVCRWHSFQVSKFNSIQFIFAMSGMEAAKMTIRSSKFNATVKNVYLVVDSMHRFGSFKEEPVITC